MNHKELLEDYRRSDLKNGNNTTLKEDVYYQLWKFANYLDDRKKPKLQWTSQPKFPKVRLV